MAENAAQCRSPEFNPLCHKRLIYFSHLLETRKLSRSQEASLLTAALQGAVSNHWASAFSVALLPTSPTGDGAARGCVSEGRRYNLALE